MDVRAVSTPGSAGDQRILRFGQFELDMRTRELRRAGALVKIQQQPFKVLALLAARAGELVTREELRQQIWGGDTYVDFDQGLNFCIKQIRTALGDQADTPRYVETLPRRGYRFIAPIEPQPPLVAPEPEDAPALPAPLPFRPAAEPRRRAADRAESRPRRRRRAAWVLALAAAGSVALAGFAAGRVSGTVEAVPSFQRLTFRRGLVDAARFTEAGEVLYTAAWDGLAPELFATRLGAPDTRGLGSPGTRLTGTAASEAAVRYLSPGNRWMLARLPLAGGPLRDIADDVGAADWSRDGRVFAAVRFDAAGAARLEMPLGRPLAGALEGLVIWMRLSPRGDRVAFLEHPVPGDDRGSVVTVDAQGGRRVLSSGWASLEGLAWSAAGDEVWFTGTRLGADSALWAVGLDGRERLVYRGPGRLVLHDVGPGGKALLSRKSLRMEVRARAAGEAQERDASWFDVPLLADITADGRGVVFVESGEGGPGYGIFLRSGAAPPVRLGEGRALTLSPDGTWLASLPLAPPFHVVLIPTGAGEPRTIREDRLQNVHELGWLPDGSSVVLAARQPDRPQRLFVQPLSGGEPRPVTPEGVTARQVVVSPDGRWVVGVPRDAAPVLYPLAGGEPRPIKGAESGDQPLQWSADGRTLFVQRGRVPMQVYEIELAGGARRLWRELAPDDRAGVSALGRICLARDTRAYAYGYGRALSELYLADGLK